MLAVGDQRPFGVTGGARRIDDEGGIVRVEMPRLLLQPGEVGLLDRGEQRIVAFQLGMGVGKHRGIVDHDDAFQSVQPIGERQDLVDVFLVLRDEHHRAAVAQLVLDLRSRGGRIDAVDDSAERLRREVANEPLLAGVAHDGDALAAGKAQLGKGARRPRHQRRIVAPAAFAIQSEMLAAEGDRVRLRARPLAQQERCGLAAQRLPVDRWRCGHAALVERFLCVSIARRTPQFYRAIGWRGRDGGPHPAPTFARLASALRAAIANRPHAYADARFCAAISSGIACGSGPGDPSARSRRS